MSPSVGELIETTGRVSKSSGLDRLDQPTPRKELEVVEGARPESWMGLAAEGACD